MELTSVSSFEELKLNPSNLLLLIHKYVEIKLIKNTILSGFINSIDPIDYSMVILTPQEDKVRTTLIPGHAILDVCIKEPNSSIKIPKKKSIDSTVICTTNRKQKVLGWLKENLLPVTEMNDNIVFGNVIILPPYQITDICTNNPMVAMQLVNIMNKMPDDYNPP